MSSSPDTTSSGRMSEEKKHDDLASASSSSIVIETQNVEKTEQTSADQKKEEPYVKSPRKIWTRALYIVTWTPPRCRWTPEAPPQFSMSTNVLFAFAGAFTVANLYYSHPILNILADDFGVKYEEASQIPTLAQVGYAIGLLFLCPLADIFKRRPMTLSMVFLTSTMWIGLCVTKSFVVFQVISFLTAVTTVTPQIMLPLVGDLAPPERRAVSLSIVTSGNLLGIMLARILSGAVANYTGWRTIYWIAFGLQYFIGILLWCFMPDYPSSNPSGLNYFKMLWSILVMLCKYPLLVQACLIVMATSAPFTSYWTTLTFLLSGPPYHYQPLVVGLWALIGIAGMCIMPFLARYVIDRFVPIFSVILGLCVGLIGTIIGTYTGDISTAGVAIQAFTLDIGLQATQIANRSSIYTIEPKARNRINTAYMVATFIGQIMGTSAGNRLYARGGWIASGSLNVALFCVALVFCLARGPWEKGWIGWSGGWAVVKQNRLTVDGTAESASPTSQHVQKIDDVEQQQQQQQPVQPHTNTEKALDELVAEDEHLDEPTKDEEARDQITTTFRAG